MNYHSDKWVMEQINRHYNYALTLYNQNQIIGVFCQGSTNYGLDTENSDIDTKCIVLPSFQDIVLNKKPISTTHILPNDEHLDAKDIRLYCQCFRKQNLNFLEILFTDFYIINPMYAEQWSRLIEQREQIARMNPFRAVKSMKGIAMEKYHAMEHEYPSKVDVLAKWGYDPKQLHHLLRVEEYLGRYIAGESYVSCLRPHRPEYLVSVKRGYYDLDTARVIANTAIDNVIRVADAFCSQTSDKEDEAMRDLLEDVSYQIMKISVEKELSK